jgi:uncharacterized lipoprotein NlpE involved in copper resistance
MYDLLSFNELDCDNYSLSQVDHGSQGSVMQVAQARGVQQEEIDAAADALLAQGLRPTVERVRGHLGRGSPNRVGPMLEAWFTRLAPRLGVATEDDPRAIPASVRKAMESVWAQALDSAQAIEGAQLASVRQALQSELEAIGQERAALELAAQAGLERELLLREARDTAQQQLANAVAQLKAIQEELAKRNQDLTEARGSIAVLVQQTDAGEREHQKQLAALAKERERLQEGAQAGERRLMGEVDRARQEAKAAEKARAEAQQHWDSQRAELEGVNRDLARTVHSLQLEQATLQERLVASERRASEFQALLSRPEKPVAPRRRKAAKPATAK